MTEETQDAIVPDETIVADAVENVVEEQSGEETPSESSTEKKESNPAQKRIDELTKLRREAEREKEYWRQQAIAAQDKPAEPAKVETVKTLEDFDYNEGQYQAYLIQQAKAGAVEEAKRIIQQEQERQTYSQRLTAHKAREAEFSKVADDYQDVVFNPSLSISQTMAEIATEMDDGPAVLYYLGKNPDIADRIATLPPLSAAREMGRIEAKLASAPKPDKVSKAPTPPPKIGGIDAALKVSATSPDSDKLSTDQWLAARKKQLSRK
jgi:hypothetical protein